MSLKKKVLLTMLVFFILLNAIPFMLPLSKSSRETPSTTFHNSSWVNIQDIEIHYRTWIPDEIEYDPIVYIHGLGGSTFSWRYNIDDFVDQGFPVVAVDLPAFGYSSRQTGLTHSQENRSEWVFGLLDILFSEVELPTTEGYHLVGHSMGGGVITAMALDRPKDIQTLTYVAGAVFNDPPSLRSLLAYPPLKRSIGVLGEYIFFTENRLERVLSSAYGEEIDPNTLDGYLQPFKVPGTGRAWGDLVTSTTSFQEEDVEEILIPAFLIWGEADSWVPLEEATPLKNVLQNVELAVIEESGHTPMETDSEEFNKLLLEFLFNNEY